MCQLHASFLRSGIHFNSNFNLFASNVFLTRKPRGDRKALGKTQGADALALVLESEVVRVAKLQLGVFESPGL